MILNILELVMMILYVLARIAGTVAIVWLIVNWKTSDDEGLVNIVMKPILIGAVIFIGLSFNVHYDNPNNHIGYSESRAEMGKEK